MVYFLRLGFLLFILALLPSLAQAQQTLARARQRSYLTKVFRLSDEQTRFLYEKGIDRARPEFFTQPIDSFPTDSVRPRQVRPLPLGHYLVAHTEGAELVYWLRAETDRQVVVLDNQLDLTLLIRDSLGHLLPDARVELARRVVPFDAAIQAFRLPGRGRAGILAVTHAGRTTFHPLEQTFPQPRYHGDEDHADSRRAASVAKMKVVQVGRRVLYGFPLGLLTRPIWKLGHDLKHASSVTTGVLGLVRSPFSEYVREQRQGRREQHQQRRAEWASYLVFSKPRYRPTGDTLRLKARLLHRPDGKPSQRTLTLWLGGGEGTPEKKLAVLRPVRPGSYEFALPITDTLGLRSDTHVAVRLANKRGATLASSTFLLEDYELSSTRYVIRVAEKKHLRGQQQTVFLRGTDANELNLLDARVRLSVTPGGRPGEFPGRQVFVPDTLWTHAQPLDATGETQLQLPSRIFPAADFTYEVQATFLNAENERQTQAATVPYRLDPGQLTVGLLADSVQLRYLHLGKSVPHAATLEVSDASELGGLFLFKGPVQLPLTLPINPRAGGYKLTDAQQRTASLLLEAENGGLTLLSERTHDSLVVAVENPRKVPFWYFIYRGNRLVYRGYSTALEMAVPARGPEPWYASLHYLWGEEMQTAEYSMLLPRKQLIVHTEQPGVAYPGQQLQLNFRVTDGGGRPVPHADLTAYAYTSKFQEAKAPSLPSFEPAVQGRMSLRRFALDEAEDLVGQSGRQLLAWGQWRHKLGLDSLQFYRFLYPESGAFHEYRLAPGGITQVAPFLVDSGRVEAPVAVYLDGQPIYIHDVNQQEPYALVADSGHHTLAIRTATRLVTLRDVYLRPLHKLTLSIDVNLPCAELVVEKRKLPLSAEEHFALSRTLLLTDQRGESARVRQGQVLRPLGSSAVVSGPFRPDLVLLRSESGLRREFLFEPMYRYTFGPELLKMSCVDPVVFGSLSGYGFGRQLPLDAFALREVDFQPRLDTQTGLQTPSRYSSGPIGPAPVLDTPTHTPAGLGRLEVRLPQRSAGWEAGGANQPLYLLLTHPDQPNFVRLLPGSQLLAHALPPGRYRVALLLADSTCLVPAEEAVVHPNGLTCFQLRQPDRRPPGALSRRIARLVRERLPKPAPTPAAELQKSRREIRVETSLVPRPDWRLLRGRVTDASTGEGLPGVTVLLKATTVGTSTAADGSFSLRVPWSGRELMFSSVGFVQIEQPIENDLVYVALRTDSKQLSEVVVTGYGTQQRRELTGSVSTVVSNSLQGRVAGVTISGSASQGISVRIRGASSAAGALPLLILDGLPFNGRLEDLDPAIIASVKTLEGAQATALYGSAASAGVLLITTKAGPDTSDGPGQDPRLMLRRRFSDYAWWRPTLVTDAEGRASTTVLLPDDITSWNTFVVGSDSHGRVGSATGLLRSFKALRAELAVPRFLVEGDRVQVLGKTLSYLPDTVQVQTSFRVGQSAARTQAHRVVSAVLDTLTVAAPAAGVSDSLQLTFSLRQAGTGFQDGEQRSLPVLPAGSRERTGTFVVLASADTTLTVPVDPALGAVTVRLESDALPILLSEIEHLQDYAYLCNEQAASKLKALLLEQQIRTLQKEPFNGTRSVNFLIRKLQDGRHTPEELWGTWPTSPVSPWATAHVLEALLAAEQAGYRVKLDRHKVEQYLLQQLDEGLRATETRTAAAANYYHYAGSPDDQIRLLQLLHRLGVTTDYATYLNRLARVQARQGRQPLDRYLALTGLRQQLGLPYQLDTLRRYRLQNQLGGVWYDDTLRLGSYYRYLLPQRVGTTLLAYQVLRAASGQQAELTRLRTFLLNLRQTSHWRSTYEAAQILETIGPDLLTAGQASFGRVQLGGAINQEVNVFPFEAQVPATAGPLRLHKEGLLPVYATAYQTRWNPAPEAKAAPFVVRTALAGQEGSRVMLTAGKPTELVVTVEVKAEARYVLLEVPIPAGCSYAEKRPGNAFEVHREYLRHQTGIFIDVLPVGRHTFRIALQPRYRGRFTVNPAKAELMYFPTRFGRSASKQAVVE